MPRLTPEIQDEAVRMITLLRSGTLDDDDLALVLGKLDKILPDPEYLEYTIDRVPELSADEVLKRAFEYRPIIL
jgi:hypothetical protein